MQTCTRLATDNIRYLQQGVDLIRRMDDTTYVRTVPSCFNSGVGGHFRHCVDHYDNFVAGLNAGRIDYDARQRDRRVETERSVAIERFENLIHKLDQLGPEDADRAVQVKMDCGADSDEAEWWSRSTVKRELLFLLSHTVHHYALIAIQLKILGMDTGPEFGVAPSTLRYHHAGLPCAQ